ncbi:hypothetical protein TNCV_1561311 [Trichonephila clavipes]|nr:hypothetical protein TNCV_1561311 [Trichonephila clavipes]
MVTGDEKWVICDNIVRKRSWSKRGEAAQMVVKPGSTVYLQLQLRRSEKCRYPQCSNSYGMPKTINNLDVPIALAFQEVPKAPQSIDGLFRQATKAMVEIILQENFR